MFLMLIVFLLLQFPPLVCNFENEPCLRRSSSVYKDGDVVLGGLFSLFLYVYYTGLVHLKPVKELFMEPLTPNSYQNVLAFLFAVEEINKNPHLLPNISLGYEFHNLIHSHWRMLESSLTLLAGQSEIPNYSCESERKTVALLTGTLWASSAQIGSLLELYKFPQVTFASFDTMLTDNHQFPSLYQVAPKDTSLALAMVSLMLYFSWTWVGLVITEGHKGLKFLSDVRGEMDKNRVCVAFVKMISTPLVSYMALVKQHAVLTKETSQVNVVIIYYDSDIPNDVNYNMEQYFLTGKVWVTNSQWHADITGKNFILPSFHGTLIFSNHREEISGFRTFIREANPSKYPEDTYLAMFWFNHFQCSFSESDCSLKDCTPNASLAWLPENRFDPATTDWSHNTHNAVYAVAHALHAMLLEQAQRPPEANREGMAFAPWQLHPFLKSLQFDGPAGDPVSLDDRRKPEGEYDILSFWNFPEGLRLKVKSGAFTPHAPRGQQLSLSDDMIEWAIEMTPASRSEGAPTCYELTSVSLSQTPRSACGESCQPGSRKSPREGKPACCFDCTPCPEPEVANGTDMEQCVKCPDDQYANTQQNRCLQKAVTFLNHEDPLGRTLVTTALSLTVLTAAVLGLFVKHRDTPIVKANNRALSYTLLISLTFCFLCSLLFIGRPDTASCVLQQTAFALVFTVAVSTVLAKTVTVVLAFKVTAPGRRMRQLLVSGAPNYIIPICSLIQLTLCAVWMGTNPPYIDTDAHSERGHIIIVCNKGSLTAFYCVLGYLGSLALASFTVAFLARNLPDTFNEAKFLTFSMLVFCSVWVTFLPVYHSTKGRVMVAMEVFSILASSAGLLGCIFAPKCYIILLNPQRNSLHGFRGKGHSRRNKS